MFKEYLYGIGKVVIYRDGQILFEKTRDLTSVGTWNGSRAESTGDKINFINLPEAPKNARKENLSRKDCYYLKYDTGYFYGDRKTALYIHESIVNVECLGEYLDMEHNGEKNYLKGYRVTFPYGAEITAHKREWLRVDCKWTIPEEEQKNGAHWARGMGDWNNSYDTIGEDAQRFYKKRHPDEEPYNVIHKWTETETITTNVYKSDFYHRTEKDDARKERERIAEEMNNALGSSSHLSHYDIERLQKVFDITFKTA